MERLRSSWLGAEPTARTQTIRFWAATPPLVIATIPCRLAWSLYSASEHTLIAKEPSFTHIHRLERTGGAIEGSETLLSPLRYGQQGADLGLSIPYSKLLIRYVKSVTILPYRHPKGKQQTLDFWCRKRTTNVVDTTMCRSRTPSWFARPRSGCAESDR